MSGDRHPRALVGALLVLSLVSGACGAVPPAASGEPASAPPAGATTAPSASASQPISGGTLSIGFTSDFQYFDPALAYDVVSWLATRLLYDQLVMYAEGSTDLVPGLAQSMPAVSTDGLVYTFTLRDGVQFVQQDGTPLREVTAEDVVFSLNRLLDPDLKPNPSPVGPAFFTIIEGAGAVVDGSAETASGLRAVDERTVEIRLAQPDARALVILAMMFGSVVPPELAGQDATAFGDAPVGTGPYYLESYTPGDRAIFRRNTHYWGPPPAIDTIEVRIGVSDSSQLQQVQSGDLDLMGDPIPSGSFNEVMNNPDLEDNVRRRIDVATFYVAMDTSGPTEALTNVRVRQALNHAVDKQNLVRIANGRGGVADCIFPPAMPGFDPSCKPYGYDPERAKAMLAEAGYADGFTTQLYTDTTDLSKAWAEALVADFAAVGVTVEPVFQDFDALLGTINEPHQAPMVLIGWFQDFPDPSDFVDPLFSCATAVPGGANTAWYCNPEVDARAAAALGETDAEARLAAYREIQQAIMADAPWIPTTFSETVILASDRVVGNPLHPVYPYDLPRLSLSD